MFERNLKLHILVELIWQLKHFVVEDLVSVIADIFSNTHPLANLLVCWSSNGTRRSHQLQLVWIALYVGLILRYREKVSFSSTSEWPHSTNCTFLLISKVPNYFWELVQFAIYDQKMFVKTSQSLRYLPYKLYTVEGVSTPYLYCTIVNEVTF